MKKIFLFLVMGLFLISMVSASVDYDPNNETYVIDTIWPSWLGGNGESVVKLVDNTDYCLIDCSFTLEFNNEEKVNLLEDIDFVNENGADMSKVIETINFEIGKYQDVQKTRPIYEEVCGDHLIPNNETGLNETQYICSDQKTGDENYTERELVWSDYNGEEVEGLSYLKANAKKSTNKRADWVITFRGERLTEWAWWNASWNYKKEVTITENSGSGLTDYQIPFNITYDAKMQNDFDDLRFLNSAETTELNYWIEDKVDGSWAYVWVKVPSITASSNTSIYMYYGNSGASSGEASATSVFEIYDDFLGSSYNTTLWENFYTGNSGGSISVSGGYVTITLNNAYAGYGLRSKGAFEFGGDFFMQSRHKSNSGEGGVSVKEQSETDRGSDIGEVHSSTNYRGIKYEEQLSQDYGSYSGSYEVFKTWSNDTTWRGIAQGYDVTATQTDVGANSFDLWLNAQHTSASISIDYVFVAKFTSGEPTYVFGQERTPLGRAEIEYVTPPTPVDQANLSVPYIPVQVNVTYENATLDNITYNFYKGNTLNASYFYPNETLFVNHTGCTCDNWYFNVTVCYSEQIGSTTNCTSTTTRSVVIDISPPVVSDAVNLTDLTLFSLPTNSTWSYNVSDAHLDSCYYNTSENATYKVITCNATENTEWATEGSKTIQFCANDTFGLETCNSTSLYIYYIQYEQSNTPETIAEGFDATFNLTVNLTSIPTTSAVLHINGSSYAGDLLSSTANSYTFGKTITIPDGWGNTTGILQDWYWTYNISTITTQNTSTDNITVYELAIDDCSSYTDVILNFTLRDEELKTPVNESAGANVEISLDLTSKTDENIYLSYSTTFTNESNPQLCLPANVLNNSQYWVDLTVGFQATDHVWEFYYIDQGTLNSTKIIESFNGHTTSNISLMDLLTTDSTSFLFNYFDQDGLAVDDAIVHVMRKYIGDGQFVEVERAKADENGDTIVHLVEEDVIYFFYITQYGQLLYQSSTYTALCQTTPCTIQIEASGDGASFDTDWDLIDGGAYTIQDDVGSRQVNVSYSLNDTSTMNVTVFKYSNDGSYSPVVSGSDTGESGSIIVTVPQGAGNVSFFASVYQDGEFVNSEWVDFEEKAQDRMGVTLALFLSALIILTLGLMAITEGVGTLVFVILGVALSGFLGLMTTELSTGVNIVLYLILAGGILLYKLTGGRR